MRWEDQIVMILYNPLNILIFLISDDEMGTEYLLDLEQ